MHPSLHTLVRPLVRPLVLAALGFCLAGGALAQEATIRKNLSERLANLPKIEEVSKTPMPGLWEVRLQGNDILYTDAEGNYLIQGALVDTRARRNLTEERLEKLSAVDFSTLPLKDAFVVTRGDGSRKMAVFTDPNCPYCKRFEADLQKISNVTIYNFLYPVLGKDSTEKAKNIWCAKDRVKAWEDWMQRNTPPAGASCETAALSRNLEFGRQHHITGTPTVLFTDGSRVPGAVGAAQLEKRLSEATSKR
jgi:thiol:disulfide interchange protein DsbC